MTAGGPRSGSGERTWILLFAAWIVSLAATLGALFIGEVMGQAPCILCWFQRAFMFPLALILAVACWRADAEIWRYALLLAGIGGLIAAFHVLQYFGMVPSRLEPCGTGPSCTGSEMTIMGWLPIPIMSLAAFAAIAVLLLRLRGRSAL